MVEIKLPDYKKIASEVKRNKVFVEEGEIEAELQWLQKSRAKFSQKIGASEIGDFLEIEFSSPQIEGGKVFKDGFILGKGHFLPGFEENLEGLRAGQEKEFSFTFPKTQKLPGSDPGSLTEKKVTFKVKTISVQNVEFPEINDRFAKNLGQFENLEDLKKSLREGIGLDKEKIETQRVRAEILEKIAEKSQLKVPENLVEMEKNRILEDLKKFVSENLKIEFQNYLNRIKKKEEELLDLFKIQAQKKVKNFLVLRAISERENIEVSDEEVRNEINKILKSYQSIEKVKKEIDPHHQNFDVGLDPEKLKSYIKEAILNEKTLQLLEGFSSKI